MKILFTLLLLGASNLSAEVIKFRTFTGWDHGYLISVDSDKETITYTSIQKKGEAPVVKIFKGAKQLAAYVKSLGKTIKVDAIGNGVDDGQIIEVSFEQDGKTRKISIDHIDMKVPFDHDPKKYKDSGKQMKEWFKTHGNPYMLQCLLVQLKQDYFANIKVEGL